MTSNGKISETMTIPEIVEKFPGTAQVFDAYGIRYKDHKALVHENLQATAKVYQIDLARILAELNQAAS
jgi:hypothetical protein